MKLFLTLKPLLTLNRINIKLFWHLTVCKENLYLYLAELELFE